MKLLAASILASALLMSGTLLYTGGVFDGLFKVAWEEPVAARLRSPESAIFRNIEVGELTGWVCGEVNGENAFGAMAGWVEFMARPPSDLKGFEREIWEIVLETDYASVVGMCN